MLDPSLLNYNFQWNEGLEPNSGNLSTSNTTGYLQLPNQRIYRSVVPDLEQQLVNIKIGDKLSNSGATDKIAREKEKGVKINKDTKTTNPGEYRGLNPLDLMYFVKTRIGIRGQV